MSSGEQPIRSFVEGGSGVGGFRVQWGSSTAPASWGTPNASRSRRRRGESRQRMECGGLPPLCEASGVEAGLPTGCYHHRVTHRCSALEREEAAARGETVAQQGGRSCGNTGSGETIGVRNGGRKSRAVGRWGRAAGRIRVCSSGPARFEVRRRRTLCWVWRPSDTTSAGPCGSLKAALPSDPKREVRRVPT